MFIYEYIRLSRNPVYFVRVAKLPTESAKVCYSPLSQAQAQTFMHTHMYTYTRPGNCR